VRDWGVGWVTQIGRAQRTGMDIWIFGVYICITGFRDVDVMFIACRECLSPEFHIHFDIVGVDVDVGLHFCLRL
jgi:hypothetical protein